MNCPVRLLLYSQPEPGYPGKLKLLLFNYQMAWMDYVVHQRASSDGMNELQTYQT